MSALCKVALGSTDGATSKKLWILLSLKISGYEVQRKNDTSRVQMGYIHRVRTIDLHGNLSNNL